jgi:class 3 adenylate cyclase
MYWRAMEVFEPLAPAMYADEVNAIAQLYYDLGNSGRSIEFARKSSEHYKRFKDRIPDDALYVSELLFARVALDKKDIPAASALLKIRFTDTQYVAYMLQRALQEVELNLLLGDVAKAETGIKKAKELEERFEVPFYSNAGVVETDYWQGKVHLAKNESQAALLAFSSALSKARESNYLPKLVLYHRSIAELHAARGDYRAAVQSLDAYIYLRDSLDFISYRTQVANGEMAVRQETLTDRLSALHTQKVLQDSKLRQTRTLLWIAALGTLLFMALAYVIYRQLSLNKRHSQELDFRGKLLQEEMRKSDQLLLNILPGNIAEELKETGQARARLYENVTVLFTDFVGFTTISAQLSPAELVEEIHRHFTAFDAIVVRHGLEKIKTIGDAYLAVCGLPEPCEDHAERTIRAAIEIRDYIRHQPSRFGIRIGVHSGPVVAGIVGVTKYAYDIWGDTVNTAARMEQKSEPGQINITGQTLQQIEHRYTCVHRGKIEAKNKGEIDMYFVIGEKPSTAGPLAS